MTPEEAVHIMHGMEFPDTDWEQQQSCEEEQLYEESLGELIDRILTLTDTIVETTTEIKKARAFLGL